MNNTQAVKILTEEKSWESDDRKIDAFILVHSPVVVLRRSITGKSLIQ